MGADTQTALVGRGETFYGQSQTIDTSDYGVTVKIEGMPMVWQNTDPSDSSKLLSAMPVYCILVRNVSGITLFKSMAVTWASGFRGRRVDGYSETTAAEIAGYVDDHLGSAGVRNGDLFWLMVKGHVLAYTTKGTGGFTGNAIAAGDILYAITAAASTGNTTAGTTKDEGGKMINLNTAGSFTATQTTDGTMTKVLKNSFGRAISAATSGETATQKLIALNVVE